MRESKDDMKVRRIDHFCSAFVYPKFLFNSLTVRTVSVAAGVIVKIQVAAIQALRNIKTKRSGFTTENGVRSFLLSIRQKMLGSKVIKSLTPNVLNLKIRHAKYLLTDPTDWSL